MDATSIILALRVLTQVGMTVDQVREMMSKGESLSEADVKAILADDRATILDNATN